MKAFLVAATLAGAAVFFSSTDAQAAGHASGFGEKGQLILSADRLVPVFGFTHSSVERDGPLNNNDIRETSSSASGISLLYGRDLSSAEEGVGNGFGQPVNVHSIPRVAFDITIINNLTLGMGIAFAFGLGGSNKTETVTSANTTVTTKVDAPTFTAIGLAPRVGYIIPIGEHLAFWPRAGFGFYSTGGKTENVNNANVVSEFKITDTLFSLDLDPQLAIIPTEHFFISVGPMLNIPVSGNRSISATVGATTTERDQNISVLHFGIHASVGGWLNVF